MSTNSQADQEPQVNSGVASTRNVRISSDTIQIEGNQVVVNDPALAKALQEWQEQGGSGEEGISIIIGTRST